MARKLELVAVEGEIVDKSAGDVDKLPEPTPIRRDYEPKRLDDRKIVPFFKPFPGRSESFRDRE